MKNYIFPAALFFASLGFLPNLSAGQAGAEPAIYKEVDSSVVVIRQEYSLGSGFIISEDGYILSNGHVVTANDQDDPKKPAKSITVILHDEKKVQGKVIGFSLNPDVALIKIDPPNGKLKPVRIGDSKAVKVGQKCFAVGAPHGLKRTYTGGILSNINRADLNTFTTVLQTDAAINPGNSGGPLFDEKGDVLGLNTYGGGGNNLGFTIPIHVAMKMKDHFLKHGYFKRAELPSFIYGELYDELGKAFGIEKGVFVHHVIPGSMADKAGIREDDIITEMNGKPVGAKTRPELLDFQWNFKTLDIGSEVKFKIKRRNNGKLKDVQVKTILIEDEPQPPHGYQMGEIKSHLYSVLGLRYRRIVRLDRVLYQLQETPGVLVLSSPDRNSEAAKAGLSWGDIISSIEGTTITDVDTFQKELEKNLLTHKKAIVLKVQKQKYTIKTALAPHYDLKGQKVVVIAPDKDYEYLDFLRQSLISTGADITYANPSGKTPEEKNFNIAKVVPLKDVTGKDFDAVLFMGGKGARSLWDNADAIRIAKEAHTGKKVIGAVGMASVILTKADPELLNVKITTAKDPEFVKIMADANAKFTGKDIKKDKKVVTTTGFEIKNMREFMKSFRMMTRK